MTSSNELLPRRELVAGLAGVGALLLAQDARAEGEKGGKPHEHKDAPPAPPVTPALRALMDALAKCEAAGRECVSRCTEHLAAGMSEMAGCQAAVMNMLAVTDAMASVAAYRTALPKNGKALAGVCAEFCTACAIECEKHAANHAECKACGEACKACAKACQAWAAEK